MAVEPDRPDRRRVFIPAQDGGGAVVTLKRPEADALEALIVRTAGQLQREREQERERRRERDRVYGIAYRARNREAIKARKRKSREAWTDEQRKRHAEYQRKLLRRDVRGPARAVPEEGTPALSTEPARA